MSSILTSLGRTVLAGFVLLVLIILALGANLSSIELPFLFRWIHVMVGIMWIGLLGISISYRFLPCQRSQMNKSQLLGK